MRFEAHRRMSRGASGALLNLVALLHPGSLGITLVCSLAGDHHHRPLASCSNDRALHQPYRSLRTVHITAVQRTPAAPRAERNASRSISLDLASAGAALPVPGTNSANTSEKNFATPLKVRSIASYLGRSAIQSVCVACQTHSLMQIGGRQPVAAGRLEKAGLLWAC